MRRTPLKRTRLRASKKTRQRRRLMKELDAEAREKVFERDGFKCVRCGKPNVQWAHIFSRRHKALRWDADNALSLCNGCHLFFFHGEPALAMDWFRKTWPERWERILGIFNSGEIRVRLGG